MSSLIDSEALHSGSEDDYSEEEQLYTDHDMEQFIDNGNYDDDEFYANPLVNKKDEEESQRVAQQLNRKILAYEQQNKTPYPISPITLSQETQEQKKQKEIQQYVKAITTTTTGVSLNTKFKPISKRNESKWRTEKSKHVQKKRGGSSFMLARLRQRKSKQTNTYKKKVTKMMYLKPSVGKKKKKRTTASSSNMMFGGYTGQCVQGSQDPYEL